MELRRTLKITDEKNGPHDSENLRAGLENRCSLIFRADSAPRQWPTGYGRRPHSPLDILRLISEEPPLCGRDCGRGVNLGPSRTRTQATAARGPRARHSSFADCQNHRLVRQRFPGLAGFRGSKTRRRRRKSVQNRGLRRSYRQAIMMAAMFTDARSELQIEAACLLAAISCMPAAPSGSVALAGASQPLR
jgi:hypothetical protein